MITLDVRDRLHSERQELLASIAQRDAELAIPVEDRGEDITASQHPADVASDLYAREIALFADLALREAVADIDAALMRIERGTYGICEDCGDRIPVGRLEARPQAARCIACQSRRERRVT